VSLEEGDFDRIAEISPGYSGADMASLCKEASYGPIRDIGHDIQNIQVDMVRTAL
jgi:SpoVK/Ycf46/Vps4 family AAA+-type ATPase